MVTRGEVEREFNDLTKKIAQLESFRHQLDSLDTRGFEKNAQLIRAKLHDVNAISSIAKELSLLRQKIKERHEEKFHFKRASREHHTETRALDNYRKLLEKKVERLEHELEERDTRIRDHLKSDMSRQRTEVSPILGHYQKILERKVAQLEHKSHESETKMREHLKSDLRTREQILAVRYKNLMRKLQGDYEDKIQTELKQEVQQRIHTVLKDKLEEEKQHLVAHFIHTNAQKLAAERKNLALSLHRHYEQKEKELEKVFHERLWALQRKFSTDKISLRKKLVAARRREHLFRERLHQAEQALAKDESLLQQKLLQVQQGEKKAFLTVHHSAQQKARIAALQTANKALSHERAVLQQKLLTLQREEKKALRSAHISALNKEKSLAAYNARQQQAFDHDRDMLLRTIARMKKTNAHSLHRAGQWASEKLAAFKKEISVHYRSEFLSLHERLLTVNKKQRSLELKGKRAHTSIAAQREQLHQRLELIKTEVQKNAASMGDAFEQKRADLQRLCARLHHRVLDLEKREHELVHKEATLRAALDRERDILHQRLRDVEERKKKALSQANEQSRAELTAYQKGLAARFTQQNDRIRARIAAIRKKERALELERSRMRVALLNKRKRLQGRFNALKISLEKNYLDLQKHMHQEAEKRALDVSNTKENLHLYREKAAAQFAQKSARLAVQSRKLEKQAGYLTQQKVMLRNQVAVERAALEKKLTATKHEEQVAIKHARVDAQQSLAAYKKEAAARFTHQVVDIKQKMHVELRSALEVMRAQNEVHLRTALEKKEQQFRKKIEAEYQQKLKLAVRKHLVAVQKKKAALERQIVAQAREFAV